MILFLRTFGLLTLLLVSGAGFASTDYSLSIDSDYTVYRNGSVAVPGLSWQIYKDGQRVLSANASYSMSQRYWNNTSGSHIEVWLEKNNVVVSNKVEYTAGQTFTYQLDLNTSYGLTRSGHLGESVQWVIEKNGNIVLQRNAANELSYTYFSNTHGSQIRVWLQKYVNGSYQRVSNYVNYHVNNELSYSVVLDQSHRITRNGNLGQPVDWVISENGMELRRESAARKLLTIEYQRVPGAVYEAWLEKQGAPGVVLSNRIGYQIDDISPTHQLTINTDGTLVRNGTLGESLQWVIEEEGMIRLKRYAANEMSYKYYALVQNKRYRFWLEKYIGSGYQRVSNIVMYGVDALPPPQTNFELSIDRDFTVYRNGAEENSGLTWVIQRNGVVVLQANASYNMQQSYWLNQLGDSFEIWLEKNKQIVSNVISYVVQQTYNYELAVSPDFHLFRSGSIGDSLQWVIEKNGVIVLKRNAATELDYRYFANNNGSDFRVWLEQFIGGSYARVSNYVSYKVGGELSYELSLDQTHRVYRTGYLGEPIEWVMYQNNKQVLRGRADSGHVFVDYDRIPGSTYLVQLEKADGSGTVVSNSIEYHIDDIIPSHQLSIAPDGTLTRSGVLGESLQWVIEEDTRIRLKRNASNELSYRQNLLPRQKYRFWLERFIGSGYQRVSNIVTY